MAQQRHIVELPIQTGTREHPHDRMPTAANLRQQRHLRPMTPVRSLLLNRLNGRLVVQNRVHLVHHDRNHKQPKQRRLQQQQHAVQHPALRFRHRRRAVLARVHPRRDDQEDRVQRQRAHVHQKLQKVLLVALPHAVVNPRTVVVHPADAPLADPAVVGPRRPVRLAPRANRPLLVLAVVVSLRVQVGKVDARLGQRHGARVEQDRLQVGHRQQEHDRVERDHVEGGPQAAKKMKEEKCI